MDLQDALCFLQAKLDPYPHSICFKLFFLTFNARDSAGFRGTARYASIQSHLSQVCKEAHFL